MKTNDEAIKTLYKQYKNNKNLKIKIILRDGNQLIGYLIGHYYNGFGEIIEWDFLEEKFVKDAKEINIFTDNDIKVKQSEILQVYFIETNETLNF